MQTSQGLPAAAPSTTGQVGTTDVDKLAKRGLYTRG